MVAPHEERFDAVAVGSPVTTENTSFQSTNGEVQTAGTAVDGRYIPGCQVTWDQTTSAGWTDAGLFTDSGVAQSAFRVYMRVDEFPLSALLHFARMDAPPSALGLAVDSLDLVSQSTYLDLAWDGTNLWAASGSTIYKLHPVTGDVLDSFPIPIGSGFSTGLTWDGTHLWVIAQNWRLLRINPTTHAVVQNFQTPGTYPQGLTWDGTNLWHADYDSALIYKINPATGAVISSIPAPGGDESYAIRGIAWVDGFLWTVNSDIPEVFKLDPATGDVLASFVPPRDPPSNTRYKPYGLTWDGVNLRLSTTDDNLVFSLAIDVNIEAVVSLAVDASGTLTGNGLDTLDSGTADLVPGAWYRVDVEMVASGEDDLTVTTDIWGGAALDSLDPTKRVGQLTGTITHGALLLPTAHLMFGRYVGTDPSVGAVTLDDVAFDEEVPQPSTPATPGDPNKPGLYLWDGTALRRLELLGIWNGSGYDPVEFLGQWDGLVVQPVDGNLADMLFVELWPVDGPPSSPWIFPGIAPEVESGRLGLNDGNQWTAQRPGVFDMRLSVADIDIGAAGSLTTFQIRRTSTGGSGAFVSAAVSGDGFVELNVVIDGVTRTLGSSFFADMSDIRVGVVGDKAELLVDNVLVASGTLTASEMSTITGTTIRITAVDLDGPPAPSIGPIRAEDLTS